MKRTGRRPAAGFGVARRYIGLPYELRNLLQSNILSMYQYTGVRSALQVIHRQVSFHHHRIVSFVYRISCFLLAARTWKSESSSFLSPPSGAGSVHYHPTSLSDIDQNGPKPSRPFRNSSCRGRPLALSASCIFRHPYSPDTPLWRVQFGKRFDSNGHSIQSWLSSVLCNALSRSAGYLRQFPSIKILSFHMSLQRSILTIRTASVVFSWSLG